MNKELQQILLLYNTKAQVNLKDTFHKDLCVCVWTYVCVYVYKYLPLPGCEDNHSFHLSLCSHLEDILTGSHNFKVPLYVAV